MPLSHWIMGLAAWRLGDLPNAVLHFEALGLSPEYSGWNDAAGPYWAARVHEKLGKFYRATFVDVKLAQNLVNLLIIELLDFLES